MTKILDMRLLLIYNLQLLKRKIEFDTVWLAHEQKQTNAADNEVYL